MDELLTISEAAEHLGVHADTLRRYEARGYLYPHYTKGGHRRYRLKELASFVWINNNPIGYFMQAHDFGKLPTFLTMFESVHVGEYDFGPATYPPKGYGLCALPIYHRLTRDFPECKHTLEKRIYLRNEREDGPLPNLNFRGKYTKVWPYKDGMDGVTIAMSEIWPEQQYCMSNRHHMAPDVIWGEEAERTPEAVVVKTVCYKRVGV